MGNPKAPTYVTDISATLNGDVYSNVEGQTKYWFRYGETADYGTATPTRAIAIADDDPHPVSEPIAGLEPETAYHFQMCVQDAGEDPPRDICSKDRSFTTGPAGGRSGIAFTSMVGSEWDVHVIAADGSGETNLTGGATGDWNFMPEWSPDGRKIVFASTRGGNGSEIYVMDADGADKVPLTDGPDWVEAPAWSPDGTKIAYVSYGATDTAVHVMDADGRNQVPLAEGPVAGERPSWSPDGSRIVFRRFPDHDIYSIRADGSDKVNLTDTADAAFAPEWSPDGRRIAFTRGWDVWTMDADGGNPVNVTNDADEEYGPSWSPDGGRLAVRLPGLTSGGIHVMNADGSDQVNLTPGAPQEEWHSWSPRP